MVLRLRIYFASVASQSISILNELFTGFVIAQCFAIRIKGKPQLVKKDCVRDYVNI